MHLSPLFETFLHNPPEDDLFDRARLADEPAPNAAAAHKEGLLRGLAVIGVLVVLLGFSCVSSALHSTDADAAATADDIIGSAVDSR